MGMMELLDSAAGGILDWFMEYWLWIAIIGGLIVIAIGVDKLF